MYIPFDYAISGGASSVEGAKVADAWKAIKMTLVLTCCRVHRL
jgi:hypothetical protein